MIFNRGWPKYELYKARKKLGMSLVSAIEDSNVRENDSQQARSFKCASRESGTGIDAFEFTINGTEVSGVFTKQALLGGVSAPIIGTEERDFQIYTGSFFRWRKATLFALGYSDLYTLYVALYGESQHFATIVVNSDGDPEMITFDCDN